MIDKKKINISKYIGNIRQAKYCSLSIQTKKSLDISNCNCNPLGQM